MTQSRKYSVYIRILIVGGKFGGQTLIFSSMSCDIPN